MLSRSGLYALQAALLLAQAEDGGPVSAARMAERLEVPPDYLAKVLHRMAQEGILRSQRGAHGGYMLAAHPDDVTVECVVEPFEGVEFPKVCLLGGPCDTADPCSAHLHRLGWNEARRKILAATRLSELLGAPRPEVAGPALTTIDI